LPGKHDQLATTFWLCGLDGSSFDYSVIQAFSGDHILQAFPSGEVHEQRKRFIGTSKNLK